MTLHVLIAPSGFKECLDAPEVGDALALGVRRAIPDAHVRLAPIADGGEGFTRALVAATGGVMSPVTVTGPVGQQVDAAVGLLGTEGPRTAVIEMAAAAGLRLVPRSLRDPQQTSTLGVGELIAHALELGAERLLVGCGDSGTNDGGMGMAHALGVRFLDDRGAVLDPVGANLGRVAAVDMDGLDPRLGGLDIEVACNIRNVLCGERGVARVFGPQKGATPEQVDALAAGLDHYAEHLEAITGRSLATTPGSGASGGLGAGLHAFCGAQLIARWDVVTRYVNLDALLDDADLVLTAEGALDAGSAEGKLPAELGRRASARGVPVVALAGTLGVGASRTLWAGVDAYTSILQEPCSLRDAIAGVERLLTDAAEQVMRMIAVGRTLNAAA